MGPRSLGNERKVYVKPLIEQLKELWKNGISTNDVSSLTSFKMYARFLWKINDFLEYKTLSRWRIKEKNGLSSL